jgi:predicted DNA-binding transcriptional regulator YafY
MARYTLRVSAQRTIILLQLMKSQYPRRVSIQQYLDALPDVAIRTIQRDLHNYAAAGIVKSDGECPAGWSLTEEGKSLLGVNNDPV